MAADQLTDTPPESASSRQRRAGGGNSLRRLRKNYGGERDDDGKHPRFTKLRAVRAFQRFVAAQAAEA
jgi:hypothetical protein